MSPLKISWKSIWSKPLSSALNIMLIAFGTGILTILLLASTQISDKLENNSKDIDLVVGAKGSPLHKGAMCQFHCFFQWNIAGWEINIVDAA